MYDQDAASPDDYVSQTGTLNGNPIACAAGLATLAELRKEGAYDRLRETGSRLRTSLVDICGQHGIAVQMCGEDAIFDVYFVDHPVQDYRDTLSADGQMMGRFNAGLLELGVLKGAQKFYPSLAHTEEDVQKTIDAFHRVVPALRG